MPQTSMQASPPVRLLFLENNPDDVELCMAEIKRAGLEASVDIVETRDQFTSQVRANTYDLVLADYQLPNWRGTEAILLLQQLGLDVPAIVVTGNLAEESSIECLRLGAADLILKDHLARLPVAIHRALREQSFRQDALRAREELAQTNEVLSTQVEELRRLNDETSSIRELGDLLQTCLTTEEAFQVIRQAGHRLFPAESGALFMLNSARNLLEAAAVWGDFQCGEGIFTPEDCWALRRGRIQSVEDPRSSLTCRHLGSTPEPGSLCMPVIAQGESLGLLHLRDNAAFAAGTRQRRAEAREQLAIRVSERIALALANLKLRESLRWQSIRDPLTGLFNRRYMEESLDRELRRAIRNNRSLSAIMLDIDHFKDFNDTFGHEAGDILLTLLGDLLQSRTRKEDIACRYGGEEFALILPEAGLGVAQQRAEELREEAKPLRVRYRGKVLERITLSIGVSSYPEHGDSAVGLLRTADAALYRAKTQGRDCVVMGQVVETGIALRASSHLSRHRAVDV